MSPDTMQAVRLHDYGGPEVLVAEQVPVPRPQSDQVLIRLVAAGVNPADAKMRAGYFKTFMPLSLPWIPGVEGAGIVEEVGETVTAFRKGQAVYGMMTGSYGEFAVALAANLQLKPAYLTFEQAAAVSMGGLTAWQAIETANLQPQQRVLIHGAAGGVGLFAVQFARLRGAEVIATASAKNVEFVRSLGAHEVMDYNAARFEAVVDKVDAVIDMVGGEVTERSWQTLKPGGILIYVVGRLTPEQQAPGLRATSSGPAPIEKLKDINALLEAKRITPVVGDIFPLAEAHQAHALIQTHHKPGRMILLTA